MLMIWFGGFFLISLIVAFVSLRLRPDERALQRQLNILTLSRNIQAGGDGLELSQKRGSGILVKLEESLKTFTFSEDLHTLIVQAGSTATVPSILVGSVLAAIGGGLVAHLAARSFPLDVVLAMAAGASWLVSLKVKRSRRLKKFDNALPDAIDLMARALRAGHSIGSMIEVVAEQSGKALALEFAVVFQQQKFGMQFRDALLDLGDRVPSKDLHFLITAILVQKETGGDLTEVLDRTARIIRERVRIQAEIKTYTAQGRLTGWILGALPIIMLGFLNVITPGYSHVLFYDPLGQKLLYAGGTMIIIGGLIIRKIVTIEV